MAIGFMSFMGIKLEGNEEDKVQEAAMDSNTLNEEDEKTAVITVEQNY